MQRVVVTGVGAVTPLGISAARSWKRLLEGAQGCINITKDPNWRHLHESVSKLTCQVAATVSEVPFGKNLNERLKFPRAFQFAEIAVMDALHDSNISSEFISSHKIGVFIGSGMPGVSEVAEASLELSQQRKISPYFIPAILGNSPGSSVARTFGLRGPVSSQSLACSTGAQAIVEAYRYLQSSARKCDIIIAGATEAPISSVSLVGFNRIKALSTKYNESPETASRPFSKSRDGFVMGEGAGMLILETLESALRRKSMIYAEIVGVGSEIDPYHPTSPDPSGTGAISAINSAIESITIDRIVGVNSHATSTPIGDEIELKVLENVFRNQSIMVSSNKGSIGHLLGAAGAVESVFAVLSVRDRVIPPNVNLIDPIHTTHSLPREKKIIDCTEFSILKTSSGFGGANVALCFSSFNA